MIENRSNWAGNITYSAESLHFPETVEQVQMLVRRGTRLKVLGSRHSFNRIADTQGDLISLDHLQPVLEIDPDMGTVTVDAGARYGNIVGPLDAAGYALHNLASLPHISVAGACATATHGSGDRNGNLASAVSKLELVKPDGEVVVMVRGDEHFDGSVVGLGGLGVVTKLTLDIVPTYQVRQDVFDNLPFSVLDENFDSILSRAYSISLLTDWQEDRFIQVWLKRVVTGDDFELEPDLFGATRAQSHRHPIMSLSAESCNEQMGIPGAWHERLPHFRMNFTPSSGEELQSEYMVPRQHAQAAFHAVASIGDKVGPVLQIGEVRTIGADNLWMSPCYHQDCIALHFTWIKDREAVKQVLPLLEERLAPFGAMPHWGKLFTMSPEKVQSLFPRLPDFQNLLQMFDPEGKFRNEFLDTYIYASR